MPGPRPQYGPSDLLTTNQVADLVQLHPRTLRTYRSRGQGPAYRRMADRTIRYRYEDVTRWLDRGLVRPSPPPPPRVTSAAPSP